MPIPDPPSEFSLSGLSWEICADPLNRGISEKWGERPPEDEPWVPATVPGTIQQVLGADFRGVAWYRVRICMPEAWRTLGGDERLRIGFDAAATDARVWVNGRFVGRHAGDFVAFEFEATEALQGRGGEIEVVVRIDQVHAPRPAKGVITEHGHIGKGFHDVLSVQHAGLWGDVRIRRTGRVSIRPFGVAIRADARDRTVTLELELTDPASGEWVPFHIHDPSGELVAAGVFQLELGQMSARATVELSNPIDAVAAPFRAIGGELQVERDRSKDPPVRLWSVGDPALYTLTLDVTPGGGGTRFYESRSVRFGLRTVALGGPDNRRILLNGTPIQLRGVLHWGHEPRHIAPAPTREQVRAEFAELKLRGFNCVCLCMVYMPEYYYEIADEVGMLIWQEHPVWKAAMGDELLPEYKRLYGEYFRRDRNHPSVVLVSGSCEHEMFNPELAAWWWKEAERELPRTLKQVQTAFFAWADPGQTDLYDEHTYDNSGRWVDYMRDVRAAIDALEDPRKPFILGETIISNAWPDIAALRAAQEGAGDVSVAVNRPAGVGAAPPASPWWISRGLDQCEALEEGIERRWGLATLHRFRMQAHRHNLNLRKFQCEVLRMDPANGGWVMNHIRDVPACRCGFMDDLGRWRYEAHELRGFLSDSALLLATGDHRRAFFGGESVRAVLQLCNFSPRALAVQANVEIVVGGKTVSSQGVELSARCGELGTAPISLGIYESDRPLELLVRAAIDGVTENEWRLWVLPRERPAAPPPLVHAAGTFTEDELSLEFEERKYSSGWGLPCATWRPQAQIPRELVEGAGAWTEGSLASGVVVTHRLTEAVVRHMEGGGRVLLLASRAAGGMDARTVMQWGGVPLIIESEEIAWPVRRGESNAVVDMLHLDLSRHFQRMVPTGEAGIADVVEPIVRFIYTHDSGKPSVFDAAFAVGVGDGMLVVSSLDHGGDAGRWMLGRLLGFAGSGAVPRSGIATADLARWVSE